MNHFEPVDGRLDGSKPDLALLELEAGTLDAPLRDEWMALVNRSPAAQLAYLGYFEISALLGAEAATPAERGDFPKIVNSEPPLRLLRRAVLAAAASVTLGAMVAALVHVSRPQVAELTVAAAAETRWSVLDEVAFRCALPHRAGVRRCASAIGSFAHSPPPCASPASPCSSSRASSLPGFINSPAASWRMWSRRRSTPPKR